MIDFKNKDELPTNIAIVGSLVVCLIAVVILEFLPKPTVPTRADEAKKERQVESDTTALKKAEVDANTKLSAYLWAGKPEDVGPLALKQVNALLQSKHLKLSGFHSQKAIEEPNITIIPFVVSVEGGFENVMSFAREIEKPGTKLAVDLFQMSNADQSSDKVTASIEVVAYQLPQGPAPSPISTPQGTDTKVKTTGVKKNA